MDYNTIDNKNRNNGRIRTRHYMLNIWDCWGHRADHFRRVIVQRVDNKTI